MYGKIFDSIFDSSIMEEDIHIRYIWMCMLTAADKEGFVDATIPALARKFNVDETLMGKSIEAFLAPDPSSRTPDADGRRIEPIRESFGWHIINYEKYRNLRTTEDRREYQRKYMQTYRSKKNSLRKTNRKQLLGKLANTDTDTDTDIKVREYITLTSDQSEKLKIRFPEERLEWMLDKLDYWAGKKDKPEVIKGYGYFRKGSWLLEEMEKHFNLSPKDSGLCERCGKGQKYMGDLCIDCHVRRDDE